MPTDSFKYFVWHFQLFSAGGIFLIKSYSIQLGLEVEPLKASEF